MNLSMLGHSQPALPTSAGCPSLTWLPARGRKGQPHSPILSPEKSPWASLGSPFLKRDGRWGSRAIQDSGCLPAAELISRPLPVSWALRWLRGAGSCVLFTCALGGPGRLQMPCTSWGSPPAIMPGSPSCCSPTSPPHWKPTEPRGQRGSLLSRGSQSYGALGWRQGRQPPLLTGHCSQSWGHGSKWDHGKLP